MLNLPLSAVVGQGEAVLALQLAAVDPSLGGVLLRGPRGTAKSTMARGLAGWIGDAPFIDLPLGADEDKLVGTLNLQAVLRDKSVQAEPGLMARANGGVLYADEVNLLPDHLVDLLLDAAASGVARIEREGVSQQFDASFVLIGTMNPDEGELRPQLLDRFGLCVDVLTPSDPTVRSQVLRQRVNAQSDMAGFRAGHEAAEADSQALLESARARLGSIDSDAAVDVIARACADAGIDGLRGDLAWLAAARAHAALFSQTSVSAVDIDATRDLALRHRLPDSPPDAPDPPRGRRPQDSLRSNDNANGAGATRDSSAANSPAPDAGSARGAGHTGRATSAPDVRGRSRIVSTGETIAWARSIERAGGVPDSMTQLQKKSRWRKQGGAWVVLLDCSASMLRGGALARTQGAVIELLQSAYWQRREVAVLRFAGDSVETLHPLGRPPKNGADFVRVVRSGGATPLMAGLRAVNDIVRRAPHRPDDMQLWLFTDGRVAPADWPKPACNVTVVDTDGARGGHAERLAVALNAVVQRLNNIGGRAA